MKWRDAGPTFLTATNVRVKVLCRTLKATGWSELSIGDVHGAVEDMVAGVILEDLQRVYCI